MCQTLNLVLSRFITPYNNLLRFIVLWDSYLWMRKLRPREVK